MNNYYWPHSVKSHYYTFFKCALCIVSLLILPFIATPMLMAQSVAGLYGIPNSGRIVYNFNQGWRFYLGDVQDAEKITFDDSSWQVVCAPHTVRLETAEASGGRNYQGIYWYRKHFVMPHDMDGHNVILHFEAIMGKQKIWVNGHLITEHEGGYTPIEINLTKCGVKTGEKCIVAVMADNSDDKTYPPGKKQSQLDFCYHGGMYRDVWLIGKSTKASLDDVFVHYANISEKSADIIFDLTLKGKAKKAVITIKNREGKIVTKREKRIVYNENNNSQLSVVNCQLSHPNLWSPENPYLYFAEIRLFDDKKCVDGGMVRIGIKKAEFKGKDGFWLNGKLYHKLIGGNRHQDFAYVGNAVPNSQQWRDAKRLKEAGMTIIRAAHYPQDPSFMDACDELGLFVIVPTPGWQYWNKDPRFAEKVHKNTRDIIRRDRNHPSVLMWEPILNETRFPKDFSKKAHNITIDEYPYEGHPVAAADMNSEGAKEFFEVVYGWPEDIGKADTPEDKCVFTREFGEMVDDWYAHNCLNRASRSWGERPMLNAALSLDHTIKEMLGGAQQFIGGCQWHPFDHQRGYHPDPYFGGIYDAFRQPKTALAAFKSNNLIDNTPYLYIANEMMPSSDEDVVVFSNCDSVRLTAFGGEKVQTVSGSPAIFVGFWNFWEARQHSYKERAWQKVSFVAEGFINGKVVISKKKMPSRRSTKLRLYADDKGKHLVADGSDFIVIVCEVTDDNGNVRRLAKDEIRFEVMGEGLIIGDECIGANPRQIEWGSAPILLQSTNKAGKINIIAHAEHVGIHSPRADTLTIESVPSVLPMCYLESPYDVKKTSSSFILSSDIGNISTISEDDRRRLLDEVEQQQQEFGIEK